MKLMLTIVVLSLLVYGYYKSEITHETKESISHKEHDAFLFTKTNKN